MDGEIRAELDRIKDEDKRQNKRLDDLEESVSDIRELVATVKELALSAKYTNEKLDKVERDVEQIKTAPLKKMDDIGTTAAKTVVSIIATALLTSLFWLIFNHGGI